MERAADAGTGSAARLRGSERADGRKDRQSKAVEGQRKGTKAKRMGEEGRGWCVCLCSGESLCSRLCVCLVRRRVDDGRESEQAEQLQQAKQGPGRQGAEVRMERREGERACGE